MKEQKISEVFNNTGNIYYGHGTGNDSQEVIDSIFENGLRCSHEQLYYTTIALGEGSETLFKDIEEKMNNWEHKDSKKIIVVSVPQKWCLIDAGTLYGKGHAAFYDFISKEESTKLGIAQGYYLKPEFVKGVYDANDKSFTQNDRYYENLPLEKQKELFDEVKKQYIDLLKGSQWSLEEYAQIMKELGNTDIPLTPEEIAQADREVFDAKVLEEQLQNIAENTREEEFNMTTQSIRENVQNEEELEYTEENEEEYTEEGWSMDDWE